MRRALIIGCLWSSAAFGTDVSVETPAVPEVPAAPDEASDGVAVQDPTFVETASATWGGAVAEVGALDGRL